MNLQIAARNLIMEKRAEQLVVRYGEPKESISRIGDIRTNVTHFYLSLSIKVEGMKHVSGKFTEWRNSLMRQLYDTCDFCDGRNVTFIYVDIITRSIGVKVERQKATMTQ